MLFPDIKLAILLSDTLFQTSTTESKNDDLWGRVQANEQKKAVEFM